MCATDQASILEAYECLIETAKHHVYIESPAFISGMQVGIRSHPPTPTPPHIVHGKRPTCPSSARQLLMALT